MMAGQIGIPQPMPSRRRAEEHSANGSSFQGPWTVIRRVMGNVRDGDGKTVPQFAGTVPLWYENPGPHTCGRPSLN
jgi:hypothetical protein